MTTTDEVVERLDKIAAILQLAFSKELTEARVELTKDPVVASILAHTSEWLQGPHVVAKVAEQTAKGKSTIYARIASLRDAHVLLSREIGGNTEYKRSGVI